MKFLIQDDKDFHRLDIELEVLKQELQKQKYIHEFEQVSIHNISKYPKGMTPVGSINFVLTYLKDVYQIANMNPLEIPETLRLDKFLGRDYSIVTAKDLPKTGYYFIKDVSQLKQFTYTGDMEHFFYDEIFDEPTPMDMRLHLKRDHLYQVSEVVHILAEYRVLVSHDKIYGIQYYDGDVMVMPTPEELKKLQEAVLRYSMDKTRPKAYAMDIAIIYSSKESKRTLIILEMCPFACLGTYGFVGSELPYMYQRGFDWYVEENTPIQPFRKEKNNESK